MQNLENEENAELRVEQPREPHKVVRLMLLGLFISNLRKERGLTATALAQKAGVHPSIITRVEQGYTTSLHERNQVAIARALDIEPEVLRHLENIPAMPMPTAVLEQVRQAVPQTPTPEVSLPLIRSWNETRRHSPDEHVQKQAEILQTYYMTGTPELCAK